LLDSPDLRTVWVIRDHQPAVVSFKLIGDRGRNHWQEF
jgi:hypothetical protein